MMTTKSKTPQIRFKGFSEAWESGEIGDYADIIAGGTPSTSNPTYWNPKQIPWMSSGEINKKRLFFTDNQISEIGLENSSAKWIKSNCVLIALAGQGKTRGTVAINHIPLTTNQSIAAIVPNEKLYFEFLYQNLENRYDELRTQSSGDGSRGGLNKQIISQISIDFPEITEQNKIGNYFQHLDKLIEQKEKKYQKLHQFKKAMLDKMFPKNGAAAPEIRFKGFSGEWEEKKLGEYAKFRRGSFPQPYGNKEWYDGEGSMPFVQVVDVTSNLALVKNTKQKISLIAQPKSVFVKQGSVVVTLQGSIGRVAILQYDAYLDRTLLIFEEFQNATDTYFWAYIIQELFEIEKKKAPGGTIKTITKDALSSFLIYIPNQDEQTKIGNYFQKLDKLINLHLQELKKLKNIKKASLEKMFV